MLIVSTRALVRQPRPCPALFVVRFGGERDLNLDGLRVLVHGFADDLLDAKHLIDNRHILQIHVAGVGDGDRVGQLVADEGLRDVDRLGDGDVARLDGQLTGNKLEDIVRGEEVLPIREGKVALQDLVGLAALGARLAGELTAEGGRLTREPGSPPDTSAPAQGRSRRYP